MNKNEKPGEIIRLLCNLVARVSLFLPSLTERFKENKFGSYELARKWKEFLKTVYMKIWPS